MRRGLCWWALLAVAAVAVVGIEPARPAAALVGSATGVSAATTTAPVVGPLHRVDPGRGEDRLVGSAVVAGGGVEMVDLAEMRVPDDPQRAGLPVDAWRLGIVRTLADGSMDPSFGTQGVVVAPAGTCQDWATAATVLADGRTVVAGGIPTESGNAPTCATIGDPGGQLYVAVYDADGAPDPAVGAAGDGIEAFTIPGVVLDVQRVSPRAGGGFVVQGTNHSTDGPVAVGFTAAGQVDTSFGVGGVVTVPTAHEGLVRWSSTGPDGSWAALSLNDGTPEQLLVTRVAASGQVVTSFGVGGVATLDVPVESPEVSIGDIAEDSQGRIVALTAQHLVRLTATGVPDPAFGVAGWVQADQLTFATVQPAGADLLVTPFGALPDASSPDDDAVAQYFNAAGAPDTRAGPDGVVDNPTHLTERGRATFTDVPSASSSEPGASLGPVVVTTTASPGWGDNDLYTYRMTPPGTLDPTFNHGEPLPVNLGDDGLNQVDAVVAAPSGGVFEGVSATGHLGVARLGAHGAPVAAFGTGGVLASPDESPGGPVTATADGGVVVAASRLLDTVPAGQDADVGELVKFRADGSVDPAFGDQGRLTFPTWPSTNTERVPMALGTLADGEIVVLFQVWQADASGGSVGFTVSYELRAYGPDGQAEATFGSGGSMTVPFEASTMAVQGYRIYVGGSVDASSDTGPTQVLVYDDRGNLDPSFADQPVTLEQDGSPVVIAPSANGTVTVAATKPNTNQWAFARATAAGTPDTSFSAPVITSLQPMRMQVDALGRTYALTEPSFGGLTLSRSQVDGALDPSWGSGGVLPLADSAAELAVQLTLQADGSLMVTGNEPMAGGAPLGSQDLVSQVVAPGDPPTVSPATATTTTAAMAPARPIEGTSAVVTARVQTSAGTPSGIVQFAVDGVPAGAGAVGPDGTATASVSFASAGNATLTATYRPLGTAYASSTVTETVAVQAPPCDANCAFTTSVFHDFLGQAPTTAELSFLTNLLDTGAATRPQLVANAATSPQWLRHLIDQFYVDTLGREPDTGGVRYWSTVLASGQRSVAQVAADFYASPEYFRGAGGNNATSWVRDLYVKLLHRSADEAGLRYWVSRTTPATRPTVALAFYQSLESRRDRVAALYDQLLGRAPDSSGSAFWAAQIATAGDISLAISLASSKEYFTRAQRRHWPADP